MSRGYTTDTNSPERGKREKIMDYHKMRKIMAAANSEDEGRLSALVVGPLLTGIFTSEEGMKAARQWVDHAVGPSCAFGKTEREWMAREWLEGCVVAEMTRSPKVGAWLNFTEGAHRYSLRCASKGVAHDRWESFQRLGFRSKKRLSVTDRPTGLELPGDPVIFGEL